MTDSIEPTNAEAEHLLTEASRALFQLGRTFGKLPQRPKVTQSSVPALDLSQILVAQAVETATRAGRSATVGVVATDLRIDPSTASRLVAQTIRAGYLTRMVSPEDARAAQLALTPAGTTLVAETRQYQRAVFEEMTADWSADERQTFARLFIKFAAAVNAALLDEGEA